MLYSLLEAGSGVAALGYSVASSLNIDWTFLSSSCQEQEFVDLLLDCDFEQAIDRPNHLKHIFYLCLVCDRNIMNFVSYIEGLSAHKLILVILYMFALELLATKNVILNYNKVGFNNINTEHDVF